MQADNSLKASEAHLRNDFKLNQRPSNETLSNGGSVKAVEEDVRREHKATLDPKDFARAVLQNCGEIRFKDQNVTTVERGTNFMRKLNHLQSPDPARTFFGTVSKNALK